MIFWGVLGCFVVDFDGFSFIFFFFDRLVLGQECWGGEKFG